MLPLPGTHFDRYRIEAILGEGGMGRVYRAFDERLERRVALKVLHRVETPGSWDSRPGADAASRLLREARAAAALDHPNAVSIFDVGEVRVSPAEPSTPFISMELIEGRGLRSFIGMAGISIEERTRWLVDVARAVAAAHARGLVHRDIKPENIMIRHDGVVKVLDFGIARRTPSGMISPNADTQLAARGTLTGEGIVIGTPLYMAPEQMRGEVIDGRADQFAWGVVAYELLSGSLPWDASGDNLKVVSEVLSKSPVRLALLNPETPALVDAVVARSMEKAPADRFGSMDEIVTSMQGGGHPGQLAAQTSPATVAAFGSAPTVQSTRTSLVAQAPAASHETKASGAAGTRSWRWLGAAASALIVLGGVGLGVRRRAAPASPAKSAEAAVPDAARPQPTAVTNLPPPKTTGPEALGAFQEGMRSLRAGDIGTSLRGFRRAVELDPRLAAAHLRMAILLTDYDPAEVRDHFSHAVESRRDLSERDALVLDAFEPIIQREPPQPEEARARFTALAVRYPMDAEIAVYLGQVEETLSAYDRAMAEYHRATSIDPDFVPPFLHETELLALKIGDFDASVAAANQCERVNPGSTTCSVFRDEIDMQEGHCATLEASARRDIVRRPGSGMGYLNSAEALFDLGSPMAAVREAMAQGMTRLDPEHRAEFLDDLADFRLEVADGRFGDAAKILRERATSLLPADSADLAKHALIAWSRMQLATEMGRPAEAIAVAKDYRARSGAWTRPASDQAFAVAQDHSVSILYPLVHAGRVSAAELERVRQAWLGGWTLDMLAHAGASLWVEAYARGASSAEDAQLALAALPRYLPFPALWEFPAGFAIGKVYLLAGRTDDAIPFLRQATTECNGLDAPFEHLQGELLLGQALETKGDVPSACAAYRVVLDRWGRATPRSVTADAARARVNALACPQ